MAAIVAGGAIGVLTFGPLVLWSLSDDVPAPVRPDGREYRFSSVDKDPDPVEISPDGRWIAYQSDEPVFAVSAPDVLFDEPRADLTEVHLVVNWFEELKQRMGN